MPLHEVVPAGASEYRFILSRETRGGGAAFLRERDVTGRVIRCSRVEERTEETPGLASSPSITLELLPDGELDRGGDFWRGAFLLDEINLKIAACYAIGEEVVFDGVLTAPPLWHHSEDDAALSLHFVGRLAVLWGEDDVDLSTGEDGMSWGHVTDDVLPALLARAKKPPRVVECGEVLLESPEPFWSYFGTPLLPDGNPTPSSATALAWDSRRRKVYVGVGEFVRVFDAAARRWETLGRLHYAGQGVDASSTSWRVQRLEYDESGDRLLGVAESDDVDIRKRASHLKACFELAL